MTSCHRSDPLTGKTGAQAALLLLQSAGCQSIMKLKTLDINRRNLFVNYPQINAAYREILNRYYWDSGRSSHPPAQDNPGAARRAAYLFPSNATGPICLEDRNYDKSKYLTTHVPVEPRLPTIPRPVPERTPWPITLDQLFSNRLAPQLPVPPNTLLHWHDNDKTPLHGIPALDQLFSSLRTDSLFQREYLACLYASAHPRPHCVTRASEDEPGEGEGASSSLSSSFCGGGNEAMGDSDGASDGALMLFVFAWRGPMWRDAARVMPVRHCRCVGGVERLVGGSCTTVVVVYS